jgi:hypothetical protein
VTLYGEGRAAVEGSREIAERLGWAERPAQAPPPEIILRPRAGDPRREPWIAPPGWRPWRAGAGPAAPGGAADAERWTFLADVPGVLPYLEALAQPRRQTVSVAIAGLGRVGGAAATVLAALPAARTGVRELLLYDIDAANQERWLLELGAVAEWRGESGLPAVRATTPEQAFHTCDVFLFVAAAGVPPLGVEDEVRLVQFQPNRGILHGFLERARAARFTGLFLVVADPVDWLALAAFHDSNTDAHGRFAGDGLAPERIAGLGLGVMWGRALAAARREGWEPAVRAHGAVFGPHDVEVIAYDDVAAPNAARSAVLTRAAREANFVIRRLGFLPHVAPGVASVALALPHLLAGREVLASVLADGLYFGCPASCEWGVLPRPIAGSPRVSAELAELEASLRVRARRLGLTWQH